jgi:hypothetical protein
VTPIPSHRPPHDCPVCGTTLALTRLACQACGTELSGVFRACEFCSLGDEEREVLRVFLTSRGNMKELERHLGVSYPTARLRFDALLAKLGLDREPPGTAPRLEVLHSLAKGEIDVDEAARRLAT